MSEQTPLGQVSAGLPAATGGAALQLGLDALRRQWRPTAAVIVLMVVPILGLYLLMVGANSFAFDYNFWNSPPPSSAADTVATISLVLLWVLETSFLAWAFSAFCVLGLDTNATARHAIRHGLGVTVRRAWRALPAMVITSVGVVFVIGGPVLIAAFAPVAIRDTQQPPSDEPSRPGTFNRCLVVSAPITALAFAAWVVGTRLDYTAVPNAAVAVLLITLVVAAAILTALTAFATAQLEQPSGTQRPPSPTTGPPRARISRHRELGRPPGSRRRPRDP